jgi:NAD(P)-dependent dehydrogenase (short-subunit alcohol dehydrogenase family)
MTLKTIVLTGASDGIGAAAALALSARGHKVVLVGRSKEKTAAIARELGAEYYLADFADLASVRALAAACSSAIRESTCWPTMPEPYSARSER